MSDQTERRSGAGSGDGSEPPLEPLGQVEQVEGDRSEAAGDARARDTAAEDVVEEASEEAFPASDPPGWIRERI